MKLTDRMHCPNCKGRLHAVSAEALRCADCERTVRIVDGIADFVGDSREWEPHADRYHGDAGLTGAAAAERVARIVGAAGDRWFGFAGDVIALGCGRGETIQAFAAGQTIRSLLVADTDMAMLRACRDLLAPPGSSTGHPVAFAMLGGGRDAISDATADTVIGSALLSGIADVRAFLTMVHRVLKPGGRAMFVVPNRRYHEAMCLAIAETLVQRRTREGTWPEGQDAVLEFLALTRRLLVHRDERSLFAEAGEKHLFDSEALEDLGGEAGFATAEVIPLDPDPAGSETMRRVCRDAGAPDGFSETFGPLAAGVGRRFFHLLARRDSSASMLLWLTKAPGPAVRVFRPHPAPPPPGFAGPEAALGGAAPRWSVELLARETPGGIRVSVGGWCLCNADVRWVRLTLDDVARDAPVWRPRPDVHDVLNRDGLYHPLNTLCSGLACELLFEGAHATDGACPFRLEVVLASGLSVTGAAPDRLAMNEPTVIAH